VLALSGAPRPQVLALACAGSVLGGFFLHERRRGRTRLVDARTLFRSLVITALGITLGITATGALASPLLPTLFAPIGVGFAAFGREKKIALLREQVAAFEADLVARALAATNQNQSEAARGLGVSRMTLIEKMKRYGLK
jgi:hypothetical protein